MPLIYHPVVNSSSSRTVSGCLTPTIQQDESKPVKRSIEHTQKYDLDQNLDSIPMSPPLSPYQRSIDINRSALQSHPNIKKVPKVSISIEIISNPKSESSDSKSETTTTINSFPVENFINCQLQLNPWNNLNKNYKSKHSKFLEQYRINSVKESRIYKDRRIHKRKQPQFQSNSDTSDNDLERVRTRRLVRESSTNLPSSEIPSTPSPPKKRKLKTTSPLVSQIVIDENIPDFSPDASTLPPNPKCLKTEWKGQPMDLSTDPNFDKLHPAEIVLASILRLPCNVYLDSKKRLFYEKVQRFRNNQLFRRTDAQKACRIDVNKASRLFASFEKVGWLNDRNFVKFLNED